MRLAIAVVVAMAQAIGCSRGPERPLEIATTTSVVNSGLLEFVLPAFGQPVRVHAAGSGRALAMLADEIVDLVISHAPDTEERMLAAHAGWRYQKFAYNRFVILGPSSDPAGIRTADSAIDAFRRIAARDAAFVSRGDQSGTHERESALWRQAGIDPTKQRVLTSGSGMASTLRQASELSAYTLSDEATWWQLQSSLQLEPLLQDDAVLMNTYAVIYPSNSEQAETLADWLAQGPGRERIAAFRTSGRQPFLLWPQNCPGEAPQARVCQS